jgi:hypothetical protein
MEQKKPIQQRQVLYLIGSWTFLNVFMNCNYPVPMISPLHILLPSLEVWLVLFSLSLLARFSIPFIFHIYIPLILFFIILRLFRFGDVLVPLYFNRPFNLYMDSGYVPDLFLLLYYSFTLPIIVLGGLGLLLLLAFSIWGIYTSLKYVYESFTSARLRIGFWAITAGQIVLVGSYFSSYYPSILPPPGTSITERLITEARFIRSIRQVKADGLSAVQMTAVQATMFKSPLKNLRDVDVHLFIIESYGQTLFSNPQHSGGFKPVAERFYTAIKEAGFHMVSHGLHSPTFGGASWLAFGTLESGVWASNQIQYNFLLNSEVRPLASYFNQAGYRTISVMPGTTLPWPEGAFFSYAKSYYAKDFVYRGPSFGWSPMPDQFVLDTIYRKEILQREQPLFVRYVLVSSHAPFHNQPVYIDDWDTIGDGMVYNHVEALTFPIKWPDLTNATEAYLRAIDYEFRVLDTYLSEYLDKDSLVIIMGDHQPHAQITGENGSWLVPVHILSRDHRLLEPFKKMGYKEGMTPKNPPEYRKMNTFMSDFLSAYSK